MEMNADDQEFFAKWSARMYEAVDINIEPIKPMTVYALRCFALHKEGAIGFFGVVERSRKISSEMLDGFVGILTDGKSHSAVLRLHAEEIDEEIRKHLGALPDTRIWLFEKAYSYLSD